MEKQLFIITGTTKGIGKSVTSELLDSGYEVFGLARGDNPFPQNKSYRHFQISITEFDKVDQILDLILSELKSNKYSFLCLFNNAAVTDPLKAIELCSIEEIKYIIEINLTAQVVLVSKMLNKFKELKIRKKIANMTSGSAKMAMLDMSLYCSTKSAISMFSECVAKEQVLNTEKFEIISINPGMVDTPMQEHSRMKNDNEFRASKFLKAAFQNGKLLDVKTISKRICLILQNQFPMGITVNAQEI